MPMHRLLGGAETEVVGRSVDGSASEPCAGQHLGAAKRVMVSTVLTAACPAAGLALGGCLDLFEGLRRSVQGRNGPPIARNRPGMLRPRCAASSAGARLRSSSLCRMNWSMSDSGRSASSTADGSAWTSGRKNQLSGSPSGTRWGVAAFCSSAACGHGAPFRIHCSNAAICCSLRRFPSKGILSSPVWRIARIRRLDSGSPGTIAGPDSPPMSNASRESTRKAPKAVSP